MSDDRVPYPAREGTESPATRAGQANSFMALRTGLSGFAVGLASHQLVAITVRGLGSNGRLFSRHQETSLTCSHGFAKAR